MCHLKHCAESGIMVTKVAIDILTGEMEARNCSLPYGQMVKISSKLTRRH